MTEERGLLADLRARVERIEQQLADRRSGDGATPGGEQQAGTWWLLEELARRSSAPAVAFGGTAPDADQNPVHWQIARDAGELLDLDWATTATALAALGHPSRLRILQLVARGEARTAAELARAEGLGTTGQIYHHLRHLVSGGWLRATTRGQHQVPPERLVPLLVVLAAAGGT